MENASKALTMAASILIGVLLLALLLYAYNQFTVVPRQEEANAKLEQMAEQNEKYAAYNRQGLKGNKLLSLLNMAEDNNIKYADVTGYLMEVEVIFNDGQTLKIANYAENKKNKDAKNIIQQKIKSATFNCTEITYGGTDGKISYMKFEEVK